jgi:predicted dehydrogenase
MHSIPSSTIDRELMPPSSNQSVSAKPKRYAVIGTGGRARMFIEGIAKDHPQQAEIVGLCDLSPTRMDWYHELLTQSYGYDSIPCVTPDRLVDLLQDQAVDTLIVCTTDASHARYCVQAMEAGCDVICEKPLATRVDDIADILDAMDRTGQDVRVAFNVRFDPKFVTVKQAIMRGVIGRPLSVDFRYSLDVSHGADYFRRWHAQREHSGGLLLHKASHHFDIVNWLLDHRPSRVTAMGGLAFYGKDNAESRGEHYDYDRYTGASPQAARDPFAFRLDIDDPWVRRLYLDAERDSGYIRDRNVFGDHVDVEDTMHVLVRYRNGAMLNYSLTAYSPWEGFDLMLSGSRGRIELAYRLEPFIPQANGVPDADPTGTTVCRVFPMFAEPYELPIESLEGGHSGADPRMLRTMIDPSADADPLGQAAGVHDGIAAVLCGIAANQSIAARGQPVDVGDLLTARRPEDGVG